MKRFKNRIDFLLNTISNPVQSKILKQKKLIPNTFIIGAMKSGTTSLYHYLSGHPDVFTTDNKEPCFFSYNSRKSIKWYLLQFPDHLNNSAKVSIDASPVYLHDSIKSARLIKKFNPNSKIVVLLRDPIERAISHYSYYSNLNSNFGQKHRGTHMIEMLSIEKAFQQNMEMKTIKRFHNYCACSLYFNQLKAFYKYFDKEKIHLMDSHALKINKKVELGMLSSFLNIDMHYFEKMQKSNSDVKSASSFIKRDVKTLDNFNVNNYNIQLLDEMESNLIEFFKEDVINLIENTGFNPSWAKKYL